jgi:hypothetical protein
MLVDPQHMPDLRATPAAASATIILKIVTMSGVGSRTKIATTRRAAKNTTPNAKARTTFDEKGATGLWHESHPNKQGINDQEAKQVGLIVPLRRGL